MTDSVLVVGSGPVGLTMALELARYGVPVRLVDKMTARSDTSRAVAVWTRSLELLERSGVSADLIPLGNKVTGANVLAGREAITRIDLSGTDSPYPYVLMVPQSDTEAVLERHVGRLGTRAELRTELTGFTQDADGITATLRRPDGTAETARFAWMIACDGSHSLIRHALNLSFDGDTMGTDWVLGDYRLTGLQFPLTDLVTYWHKNGPLVLFPMSEGRYRLIASFGASSGGPLAPPPNETFQAIVDQRGPGGITLGAPIWTSAFRINERQVSQYRVGRVFLAGDAAHVHSPAGGQGMNTGMQDAFNLAWKLALVCRGLSSAPALLDSYERERKPVGAEVIASSGRLTKLATLSNPLAQELRNTIGRLILGLASVRHAVASGMTETAFRYADSPLNGPVTNGHEAGGRVPPVAGEMPYGSGDTPRFTIRTTATPAQPLPASALVDPAIRRNVAGGGIEVVRPDGYLAMSAAEGDWPAVAAYLSRFAAAA